MVYTIVVFVKITHFVNIIDAINEGTLNSKALNILASMFTIIDLIVGCLVLFMGLPICDAIEHYDILEMMELENVVEQKDIKKVYGAADEMNDLFGKVKDEEKGRAPPNDSLREKELEIQKLREERKIYELREEQRKREEQERKRKEEEEEVMHQKQEEERKKKEIEEIIRQKEEQKKSKNQIDRKKREKSRNIKKNKRREEAERKEEKESEEIKEKKKCRRKRQRREK